MVELRRRKLVDPPTAPQASLSGTDQAPFEQTKQTVYRTYTYMICTNYGYVTRVWVHVRYMHLPLPDLLRSGTDELA